MFRFWNKRTRIATYLLILWVLTAAPGGGCKSCNKPQKLEFTRLDAATPAQNSGFGDSARVGSNRKVDSQSIQAQFDPETVTGDDISEQGFYQDGGFVQESSG